MNALRLSISVALILIAGKIAAEEPLGTLKVDPIALVAGQETAGLESLAFEYQHYRYLFANEENLAKFKQNPDRYEIQLGGACGSMGVLSGRGTPDLFSVHDGKIYIFASAGCKARFMRDPDILLQEPDKKPEASDEALADGKQLLTLMLQGVGGEEAVNNVKNYRLTIKKPIESGGQTYAYEQSNLVSRTDAVRQETKWDSSAWTSIATADDGCFLSATRNEWMAPVQRTALRREMINHSLLGILTNRNRDDFFAFSSGVDHVGDQQVSLLTVYFDETLNELAVDPKTGRVLRMTYRGSGPGAVIGELAYTFADFAEINGLTLPRSAVVTFDGEPFAQPCYTQAELAVNEDLPEGSFDRPQQ